MKDTNILIGGRRARRHFTANQIVEFLRRFDRSGLSALAFARQRDLTYSVLLRWLRRRRKSRGQWPGAALRATTSRVPRHPILHEVQLPAVLSGTRWAAEIIRGDGSTLRLAHDVPDMLLGQLLRPGPC